MRRRNKVAKYNSLTPELAAAIEKILGKDRFLYGAAVKEEYSRDEMPIYGKYPPDAV